MNGEDVATCPSCSLIIKVIYDKVRSQVLKRGRGERVARTLSSLPVISKCRRLFSNGALGKCYILK